MLFRSVFLYFFALITEEGFLISPCYSLELCIQMGVSFLFSFAFGSSFHLPATSRLPHFLQQPPDMRPPRCFLQKARGRGKEWRKKETDEREAGRIVFLPLPWLEWGVPCQNTCMPFFSFTPEKQPPSALPRPPGAGFIPPVGGRGELWPRGPVLR